MTDRDHQSRIEELNRLLRESEKARPVLKALARITWAIQKGFTSECPESHIPTIEMLAAWLDQCPSASWRTAGERTKALFADDDLPYLLHPARAAAQGQEDVFRIVTYTAPNGQESWYPWQTAIPLGGPRESVTRTDIEAIHSAWKKVPGAKHPLAPLVQAWQKRPRKVLPDTDRETGIMPQALRIRSDIRETEELIDWPEGPGIGNATENSGWLPGLEPPPSRIVPALPLVIFDATGRLSTSRGRGASIALRLAIELLMAVPRGDRERAVEIEFSLSQLVSWLWPGKRRPKPNEFWPRIKAARYELHNAAIPISDTEFWVPFVSRLFPKVPDRKACFIFELRLPPGSDIGPRVHRPTLRLYGLQSAPKYRAWLGLSYLWHKHLRYNLPARGGGTRTRIHAPTLPTVKRDKRTGGILDVHGRPVTYKGGKPVKSPLHPAAVPILSPSGKPEIKRNPAMDRLPELGPDELIELTMPHPENLRGAKRRVAAQRSRRTLEAMERSGDIVLEKLHGGWRILPPGDILERFRR